MPRERLGFFELIILVLSVYVLLALAATTFFNLDPQVALLLYYIDNCICIFFFIDFVRRFREADNKWAFMKWGWIDLLASIPVIESLRWGRALRLFRIIRLLRAFRSAQILIRYLFRNRVHGTLSSAVLIAVLTLILSSIAILQVERSASGANIKTAGDALWWGFVTITTVGYGDRFPVTTEGRLIAAVLMTVGVGLFGTFTAYIASWFVEEREEQEERAASGDSQQATGESDLVP